MKILLQEKGLGSAEADQGETDQRTAQGRERRFRERLAGVQGRAFGVFRAGNVTENNLRFGMLSGTKHGQAAGAGAKRGGQQGKMRDQMAQRLPRR